MNRYKTWIKKILIVLGILFIASMVLIIIEHAVIKSRFNQPIKSEIRKSSSDISICFKYDTL